MAVSLAQLKIGGHEEYPLISHLREVAYFPCALILRPKKLHNLEISHQTNLLSRSNRYFHVGNPQIFFVSIELGLEHTNTLVKTMNLRGFHLLEQMSSCRRPLQVISEDERETSV